MKWYELDKDARARIAPAIVEGYTAIPPTDEEADWADKSTIQMIAEELLDQTKLARHSRFPGLSDRTTDSAGTIRQITRAAKLRGRPMTGGSPLR